MTAPFIVRSVSRIHPGKADAYRPVAAEFCRLAQRASLDCSASISTSPTTAAPRSSSRSIPMQSPCSTTSR